MMNRDPINVGFDATNITITINDTLIPISDNTTLQENSKQLLDNENFPDNEKIRRYMMIRTICDIIKDATNATVTVNKPNIINILEQIFPVDIVNLASQNTTLEKIKAISNNICTDFISGRVFIKSAYTDHIPLQVTHVFNESGAKPDTFSPNNARIMSSFASVADPATRTDPTECFPTLVDVRLQFDNSFMNLVGFLRETTWQATQTSEFDRNNSNNTEYSFSINVGNDGGIVSGINATKNNIDKTDFSDPITGKGYYFQGNPTKNKFIDRNLENIPEILRYMIIKEMGDMMQVYVMLVWFYSQNPQNSQNPQITKDKFLMSTTDLVVMNTCQLFQMPCLYTNQGKDTSLLTEQEKTDFKYMLEEKMDNRGTEIYKNWKKNNKFANTLYYLPVVEAEGDKLKRRLNTIYYIIKSQNEKQLGIFKKALEKVDRLRYIKMGRLGPLMTFFSNNNNIIQQIINQIIENIQTINYNLLVKYNTFFENEIFNNTYQEETTDIELKKQFSLHILITRQKYPPTSGNTHVYVIQNLTHYTEELSIGNNGTLKLVDMMLDTIRDKNNINNFATILKQGEGVIEEPELNIPENPKVSGPGPNENWLIYSILRWFNNVSDKLSNSFGWSFDPIVDYSSNLSLVGGMVKEEQENKNININNLGHFYEKIGFVTLIPCIYEQLCSIYEKHNEVYGNVYGGAELKYGEIFVENFILNLTRYQTNKNIPTLKSPYNSIDVGQDDKPIPYSFNLIYSIPDMKDSESHHNKYLSYEECVIHTDDIDFEIQNTNDEELKHELENKKNELIANNNIDNNNVFTVDDKFAGTLFEKSGITFNEPQEESISSIVPSRQEENIVQTQISNEEQLTTPQNGSPEQNTILMATPINSQEDLQIFLSPEKSENEQNKKDLFSFIITPLKEKQIKGIEGLEVLENISFENILEEENSKGLIDILEKINKDNDNIILNDDPKLKQTIKSFIERGIILPEAPIFDGFGGTSIINGNKKTRRRNKRSHKKHHKTNKKHKKYQKSGKNKTRKIKKAKRKNKTV